MEQGFIFGGDTGQTYADIQKRRKLAEQFGRSVGGPLPKTAIDGVGSVVDALLGRHNTRKADRMQGQLAQKLGPDHPIVLALMGVPQGVQQAAQRHVPQYRRGTGYHPGGPAIVGEEGPEAVVLPPGTQVLPSDQTADPAFLGEFLNLSPEDRARTIERMQQGMSPAEAIMPEGYDPGEMIGPQSRFNDAAAFQTAQAGTGTMSDAAPAGFSQRAREAAPNLDLNVTQAQRSGQAMRLLQAESILGELENQGTRTWQNALELLPDRIENHLVDEDYGRFKQARDAFAEAAMRADTGATINESEWPRIIKNLMPQPGDGPERLAQRRAMREVFINSLLMSSGEATQIMPEIGQPVVPVQAGNPAELSDEDLLRLLNGGN